MKEYETKDDQSQSNNKENPADIINEDSEGKIKSGEKQNTSEKKKSIYTKIREFFIKFQWTPIFTGVIALATIIYVIVASCQLKTMNRQLTISERAWLMSNGVSMKEIGEGKKLRIEARFGNAGKTPALDVRLHLTPDFTSEIVLSPELNFRFKISGPVSRVVLGPSTGFNTTMTSDKEMTKDLLDVLNAKTSKLNIAGIIEYSDIFNKLHCTSFCFIYNSTTESFVGCETGNTIDDVENTNQQNCYEQMGAFHILNTPAP